MHRQKGFSRIDKRVSIFSDPQQAVEAGWQNYLVDSSGWDKGIKKAILEISSL